MMREAHSCFYNDTAAAHDNDDSDETQVNNLLTGSLIRTYIFILH